MRTRHPFEPYVFENTKKLIIGTLPPETAKSYFSNHANSRLWDLLFAIHQNNEVVGKGARLFDGGKKDQILKDLSIGISDIIKGYDREKLTVKDDHILPNSYNDFSPILDSCPINEFLFVYKSAAKWFLHSLENKPPVRLRRLNNYSVEYGDFFEFEYKGRHIKCVCLPQPVNKGEAGFTIPVKFNWYKKYILR